MFAGCRLLWEWDVQCTVKWKRKLKGTLNCLSQIRRRFLRKSFIKCADISLLLVQSNIPNVLNSSIESNICLNCNELEDFHDFATGTTSFAYYQFIYWVQNFLPVSASFFDLCTFLHVVKTKRFQQTNAAPRNYGLPKSANMKCWLHICVSKTTSSQILKHLA